MRPLLSILRLMIRDQPAALARGALLSVLVLLMGAALLGLSGWFITAAAAAGLAGAGAVFDVFRPSAMVRFLALGRTAARYGERLLTHDATLRALTAIRLRLLSGLTRAPFERLARFRAAEALNRVTADIDALDGLPLRLVLPALAAVATLLTVLAVLWWLVDPRLALLVAGIYAATAALALAFGLRAATAPARRAEAATQALRTRLIDLVSARADLAMLGQLRTQADSVAAAETRRADEAATLDRIGRRAGVLLSLGGACAVAGALWLGGTLAQNGTITPATAAIAVFVALALAEAIAPFRRALLDTGRMVQAARRIARTLDSAETESAPATAAPSGPLELQDVTFIRPGSARPVIDGVSLHLAPGTTTALTGPSGCGKSTLLMIAAGLLSPSSGRVTLGGQPLDAIAPSALRRAVTLVPQRAALLQGSVAENLRLAAPEADEATLWQALEAAQLAGVIRDRGGLSAPLGPRGSGLSGGESRRLVLARALLRRPRVLLLDEPTEGLDSPTARAVMAGLRRALPEAALIVAAHRDEEIEAAETRVTLGRCDLGPPQKT